MYSIIQKMIFFTFLFDYSKSFCIKNDCPSVKLQTNPPVNISEYIRKSWYIQQQQINGYQKEEDLFCVVATYNMDSNSKVPFFSGKVLSVYNYANSKYVNGNPMGYTNTTNTSMILCAREKDSNHPEKLSVAPCFLPNILSGPYWILYAGPTSYNYKWAIVIGGQPTEKINNTCTTKESGINNSGLWIFSRDKLLPQNELNYLHNILANKNISTDRLLNVSQKNCKYSRAYLK